METVDMKKLMFLTMMLGLMMAISGNVSAQMPGKVVGATGSQKVTPKVGSLIKLTLHEARSDNPAQGIKSGRQYALINLFAGADDKSQYIDIVLEARTPAGEKSGNKYKAKIIKVENPVSELLINDRVDFDFNGKTGTLKFSRGSKVFGKITFQKL